MNNDSVTMTTGWRPRRTVLIASWGAKEHGIMGSAEWVEVCVMSQFKFSYLTRNNNSLLLHFSDPP